MIPHIGTILTQQKKIAILASGTGSNAVNLIQRFNVAGSPVHVTTVITNRQKAAVREKAEALSVECLYFPKGEWLSGHEVVATLRERGIDLVVLAGFLAMIPEALLEAYPDKIINIHPSLLPKHGGKGMYGIHVHESVLAAGDTQSGITIHYINEHYDQGAVIAQLACPVMPDDTPETLAERVHALEYKYYPQVISELLLG